VQPTSRGRWVCFSSGIGVQGTRFHSSVPLGMAVELIRASTKIEARGNQPQATEGLLDLISASWQTRCSIRERAVFCGNPIHSP